MESVEERLSELVLRWEELKQHGQAVSAEDLCVDCPELLAEVRRRIEALANLDPLLVTGSHSDPPPLARLSPAGAAGGAWGPAGYELLGELGHGGMGVVFRALDQRRGEVVALKTMQRIGPSALSRFKREFRALADVAHPNLVTLYELVADEHGWFFTMELVDGVDFLTFVKTEPAGTDAGTVLDHASPRSSQSTGADPPATRVPIPDAIPPGPPPSSSALPHESTSDATTRRDPVLSPSQLGRLLAALRQLAEGVSALHAAGKLHRDIKPSNVLVTDRARVVLLDFGLSAELEPTGLYQSTEPHVFGTVAYMAPEQAAGLPVSPASDWYSVGVMLYEALTGRLPIRGRPLDVLMDKQRLDPPPPRQLTPEVPEDLDALCVDLLVRDPASRPSGGDVLRRLGGVSIGPTPASPPRRSSGWDGPLVGRTRHLEALAGAYASMKGGRTVALYVRGRSGVGKSALVQRFLADLPDGDGAVILAGRCYERESVPYKALDGVVDALARYLRRLPAPDARSLLPRDIPLLARVFPVLGHAEAMAAQRRVLEVPDPHELRRRAFAALRELLARVGDLRPLVVVVDDLQWGDLDSAALLADLLRPPDPPVLLLLACYRSEDDATSPVLRELLGGTGFMGGDLDRRELAVEELSQEDAEGLALTLLAGEVPIESARAATIARESGGNPFFVAELVRHVKAGADSRNPAPDREGVSLEEVLWSRILHLPDEARRMLEVIAVSGRPIGEAAVCRAADVATDERAALALLRVGRLIRGIGPAERSEIEAYHDRVREAVTSRMPPDALSVHHLRLALVLEAGEQADPEVLADHFRGAGQRARAGDYYAQAAARAAAALAFDRAANLYRRALEHRPESETLACGLRAKFADALANAGRGGEAAEAYLAAALAGGDEAIEWRRRAAEQYLTSGRVDEGVGLLREVAAESGLSLPRTRFRTILALLAERCVLRLRGIRFRERPPEAISRDQLRRIDVCWSAGTGLIVTDYIQGAYFQTRGLLLALGTGELGRVVRALALEGMHATAPGPAGDARSRRILDAAAGLAARSTDPYPRAIVDLARGMADFLAGRFRGAADSLGAAEGVLRSSCTGVSWELDTAKVWRLLALLFMGRLAELAECLPELLLDARDRGDLYAEVYISAFINTAVLLAADRPGVAREELRAATAKWSQRGFHVQHHNALVGTLLIHLHLGEGAQAWEYVREKEPLYRHALLWGVQQVRIDVLQLRARCALAAARAAPDPAPLLRYAEQDALSLARESAEWGRALGALVRACVATSRTDPRGVAGLFEAAATRLEAADLGMFAAVARYRQGERTDGEEGGRLRDRAIDWLANQGVLNPQRAISSHAPIVQSQ